MRKVRSSQKYTWTEFDFDITRMVVTLRSIAERFESARGFSRVWSPHRGGLVPAVCLSHALEIPLAPNPLGPRETLIVDDIADSGRTLEKFYENGYFISTLFYHKHCSFVPHIWFREKTDRFIDFPWEYK